jgi:outer membrane protein assembly factor BamB
MFKNKCCLILFIVIQTLILSCHKDTSPRSTTPPDTLSSIKEITSFTLKKQDGTLLNSSQVLITIVADTIKAELPYGTDITNLTPEIIIKGVSISPASGVAQNFSSPVVYTVTAEDKSQKKYVVVVSVSKQSLLYMGTNNNMFYALDAASGQVVWSYTGGGAFTYSSPTYNNGVVYVGCIDSYVYAFNALTGAVLWKFKAGDTGVESDAVFFNNTIYVGSNDDYLYALDAATGNLKWKFLTGGNVSSSPTFLNNVVYFGSSDSYLYALDANTGNLIWKYACGSMIDQSGATIANGIVYVGSRDAYLHAVDANTGTGIWKFSTNGVSMEQASPTVVNGTVYCASWYDVSNFGSKGSVYAIDAVTGTQKWVALDKKAFSTSPFVHNNRLFICDDDGFIDALNTNDGSLIWQKKIYANSASPVENNNIVFVGGGGTQYFYALDALTGQEIWKFNLQGALTTSSPLIVDKGGIPVFCGDSGNNY